MSGSPPFGVDDDVAMLRRQRDSASARARELEHEVGTLRARVKRLELMAWTRILRRRLWNRARAALPRGVRAEPAVGPARFSIVTPVHDPPLSLLRACLDSIEAQTFPNWELRLVDDGSSDAAVLSELRERSGRDPRIHLAERSTAGGIVAASNDALRDAVGEFVVLVDHDDQIEPDALEVVDEALRGDPEIDYLYSDEDKFGDDGTIYDLFLKPDWSPERLRSQNYCAHLSVLRRSIVEEVGGFREGYDGSQDHDLVLRVSERARHIHHVRRVLYHWCVSPRSVAGDPDAKPYAQDTGRRCVEDHLRRTGHSATVEPMERPGRYRVRRCHPAPPSVSIIVPTRGTRREVWGVEDALVNAAVGSVVTVTDYDEFEIIVVADPDTPASVLDGLAGDRVRVVSADGPFNFSSRCNLGAEHARGDALLFLNDDTLVEQPDWLAVMASFLEDDDVGAVGARLLYADGTLQHAGILLNEQPHHIFRGFAADDPGPFGLLEIDREVSAVTGACLLTTRQVFEELGGFPEEFAVAFNDLDYCLRVRESGRRVVWTAHATLFHFESQTRAPEAAPDEIELLYAKWADELFDDPYGSPGFEPRRADWLPRIYTSPGARLWARVQARVKSLLP